MTALMRAAYNDQPDIVQTLIDHGADVNAKDKDNWTALYVAAWNGNAGAAKVLLDHGANCERAGQIGHDAAECGRC